MVEAAKQTAASTALDVVEPVEPATSGVQLGIGEATHRDGPVMFDQRRPGYWLVDVPDAGDWRLPHPLTQQAEATPTDGDGSPPPRSPLRTIKFSRPS